MFDYFLNHLFQYFLVLLIFLGSLFGLMLLEDRAVKIALVFFLSCLYFFWGVVHHLEEKNLTKTIILEYLVIAALIFWTLVNVI